VNIWRNNEGLSGPSNFIPINTERFFPGNKDGRSMKLAPYIQLVPRIRMCVGETWRNIKIFQILPSVIIINDVMSE